MKRDSAKTKTTDATHGPAAATRLRDRIDRGCTADKVASPDPAAAPLGTDDEAAGTPPTMAQVRRAAELEGSRKAQPSRESSVVQRVHLALRNPVILTILFALAIVAILIFSAA
jgi:hypothetical protein